MILANIGYDLQSFSEGRFNLGLGSQIKAHIEKRFSMPWSHPAPRMRELILAIKAIWDSWNDGTKLDFRGDFYTHTLMTPFFSPGPNPFGNPRIFLAGVGEKMTEVAGEVAEGFFAHSFLTESYLREVIVPALERGRAAGGNDLTGYEISVPSVHKRYGDCIQRISFYAPYKSDQVARRDGGPEGRLTARGLLRCRTSAGSQGHAAVQLPP